MTDARDRLPLTARAARAIISHPRAGLALLGQRRPVWRDGRRLHPAMQLLAAAAGRIEQAGQPADPVRARRDMRRLVRLSSPVRRHVRAVDRLVPGTEAGPPVPVRVYRPYGDLGDLPAVVFAHGGGFVTGDLETHDPTCRLLADTARCAVVAVDYRLAPEHPFPAAVDDLTTAWAWVHTQARELGIDAARVAVMGDSAGGNLAAVLCLEARRLGLPRPVAQGLVYPVTDMRLRAPSYETFAAGFSLTRAAIEWMRVQYVPDRAAWDDSRVSPLLAGDLSGLPPALVVTAGFDPLRDDGRAYADALRSAGVPVTYRCYDDLLHGFHGMLVLPDAYDAAVEIDAYVGDLLRRPAPSLRSDHRTIADPTGDLAGSPPGRAKALRD